MKAKYIVFSNDGIEQAVVFPFCVTHRYIWNAVRTSTRNYAMGPVELRGAGFFDVDDEGTPFTYGRSTTLDLSSRVEDTAIVEKILRGQG